MTPLQTKIAGIYSLWDTQRQISAKIARLNAKLKEIDL